MTLQYLRQIAVGATEAQIMRHGNDPKEVSGDYAYGVLDGMCQDPQHKNKLFKEWWERSTPNQYELFKRDWRKAQRYRAKLERRNK